MNHLTPDFGIGFLTALLLVMVVVFVHLNFGIPKETNSASIKIPKSPNFFFDNPQDLISRIPTSGGLLELQQEIKAEIEARKKRSSNWWNDLDKWKKKTGFLED